MKFFILCLIGGSFAMTSCVNVREKDSSPSVTTSTTEQTTVRSQPRRSTTTVETQNVRTY